MKLHHLGIDNGWQLRNMPEDWARKNMGGVVGVRMIRELNGHSCIPMKDPLETKKMIATTRMFGKPVYELSDIKEAIATYVARAAEKLRRQFSAATTIQVFLVTNGTRNDIGTNDIGAFLELEEHCADIVRNDAVWRGRPRRTRGPRGPAPPPAPARTPAP